MRFLRRLFKGPEGTRETIREAYATHRELHAQSDSFSPHERGLYGVLESRYLAAGAPRPEIQIWTELIPFLLMDESEGVEALAELMVLEELPLEARAAWLGDQIRSAIRERLPDASDFLRSGAARALRQGHRPWLGFLTGVEQQVIRAAGPDGESGGT